jgi:hypothetical protein
LIVCFFDRNCVIYYAIPINKTITINLNKKDQNGTLQTTAMDLRRQTCIIASPKILKNKDGTFKFVTVTNSNTTGVGADPFSNNNYNMRNIYMDDSNFKINDFQKTPHRRSLSSSNLDTTAGKISYYFEKLFIYLLFQKIDF